MTTQAPSRAVILVTVAFALSCFVLALFVWDTLGGSSPLQSRSYRIGAVFTDASQLDVDADVRIAGVSVGHVTKVVQDGLDTRVQMEIKPEYVPIPRDARALLRQKTLLGETFVALSPGRRSRGVLHDGDTIARSQIEQRQPLDRLLGALDAKTRSDVTSVLIGSATAFGGRGQDLNNALGSLDPASAQLSTILRILDGQSGEVRSLVRDTGTALGAVSSRGADVQGLVSGTSDVLAETAARRRALTGALRAMPPLVHDVDDTMQRVDHTAGLATPALKALRPVARTAPRTLRDFNSVAPRITALFQRFGRTLPTAKRALPSLAAVFRNLGPFGAAVEPAAENIVPSIELLSRYSPEITSSMANIAASSAARSPDTTGKQRNYIRVLPPFTDEGLIGYTQRLPTNRHNAYPQPGEWSRIGAEGLRTSDCRNVGNPQTTPVLGTGAPPCVVQGGFQFDGKTGYFPQMSRVRPPK